MLRYHVKQSDPEVPVRARIPTGVRGPPEDAALIAFLAGDARGPFTADCDWTA